MAYSTSSPPAMISQRVGTAAGALWWYTSTDDKATVQVTNYFTNGDALGMKVGDIVYVLDNNASPVEVSIHIVSDVTSGGQADLSNGTAITATDSD